MAVVWLLAPVASAQETDAESSGPVTVVVSETRDRPELDLCPTHLERKQLSLGLLRDAPDLLDRVPGMVVEQVYGRGGARLMAYRGYDAFNGRDIATFVDGVPLNQPGAALGHGYADLRIVPRMLMRELTFCSGVQDAEVGGFGTAGSTRVRVGLPREGFYGQLGGASDGSGRLTLAWRPSRWSESTYVLGELDGGEGVGRGRGWRDIRLAAGIEGTAGSVRGKGYIWFHDSRFDVPPLLSEADLVAGNVSFFSDYVDHYGRGSSTRLLGGGQIERGWWWGALVADAWVHAHGEKVAQNLTGFEEDETFGDGRERVQSGTDLGLHARVHRSWRRADGRTNRLQAGVWMRGTFSEWRIRSVTTTGRVSQERSSEERGQEERVGVAAYVQQDQHIGRWGGVQAALRLEEQAIRSGENASGDGLGTRTGSFLFAPRFRLWLDAGWNTRVWLSAGRGYRPPVYPGQTDDGPVLSYLTDTVEARGVWNSPQGLFDLNSAVFYAYSRKDQFHDRLDPSIVWGSDVRRFGGEVDIGWWVRSWIRLGLQLSANEARWLTLDTRVPYAPVWTSAVSLQVNEYNVYRELSVGGWLRALAVGHRWLPAGVWQEPYMRVDLAARASWLNWYAELAVQNAVPVRWTYAQAVTESDWQLGYESTGPSTHFIAGEPFTVSVTMGVQF